MKKRLFIMIVLCVCALCTACHNSKCEHFYSIKFDETYHWYECDYCQDISRKEVHNTSGANGECTSCHYKKGSTEQPHTHVWATSLTYDETSHWYACTIEGCKEKKEISPHEFVNGVCVCTYHQGGTDNPPDNPGDDDFNNVSVSTKGILSWNMIKNATKYVLKITYAAESDSTEYTIEKTKNSVNLEELRQEGFPVGKSSVELLVYENAEVELDGKTYYQEVLMKDVKESFRIVKSNEDYSLVRLSYSDSNLKLDGFYDKKQTIENKSVYLYEYVLKENKPGTFKIKNYVNAKDAKHTLYFYKSEAGRTAQDSSNLWSSSELQMGYPQVYHGANFYYVRVVNEETGESFNYDLCVYGLYTLTIQRFNRSFTETNGLRDNTDTPIGEDLKYVEMDIIPQEVLYAGVDSGKLGRSAQYEVVEKEDLTLLSDSEKITYYFYDEQIVRSDCQTYAKWSETYRLDEYPQGWNLCGDYGRASGMVILPNILIGKKVISATFYNSIYDTDTIRTLIVEEGAETLTAKFDGCWSLLDIFLPSTITDMPKNAFAGVNSNVVVHCAFSRSVANNFPLYWDRDVNKQITTEFGVTIPENTLTIQNGLVFSLGEKEDELIITSTLSSFDGNIPDDLSLNGKTYKVTGIATIGNYTTLAIGKNIKFIAEEVFENLTNVSLSTENQYFVIQDGILYNKEYTTALYLMDNTKSSLVLDRRVQKIPFGLLKDLDGLESLSVPFVGAQPNSTDNTHFGYIFGAASYLDNSVYVPSSLKILMITEGETIKDDAFYNCNNLTSIEISNSITSIGTTAFSSCNNLESIIVSNGNSIYTSQDGILYNKTKTEIICVPQAIKGDVTIPDGITSIGSNAFYNCSNLTSLMIPNSVENIENNAFDGCSNLQYNEYENAYYLGNNTNPYVILIKSKDTSISLCAINKSTKFIYESAFNNCSKLESITVEENNINYASQDGILYNKTKTEIICIPQAIKGTITIPNSITSIGDSAFNNCSKLEGIIVEENNINYASQDGILYNKTKTEIICIPQAIKGAITIPDGITSIGSDAFYNCNNLTSVTIPNSVESIGNNAFYGCNSLTSITLPFVGARKDGKGNTRFGYIFGKDIYSYDTYLIPSSLKTVVITSGSSIENYAFDGCNNLTSITIPDSIERIGYAAFKGCNNLTNITLPFVGASKNGTTNTHFGYIFGADRYNDNASYVPSSLNTVVITGGLSIEGNAFYNCRNLTSIMIPNSTENIENNAFDGCENLQYNECENAYYLGNNTNLYVVLIRSKDTSITSCAINDNTKFIYKNAFYNCSNLTSMAIPARVKSIGSNAFYNCNKLEGISVDKNNINYASQDGILYNKNKTEIICIPQAIKGAITIPEGITNIGSNVFYNCSNLTSITIPASVESIGDSAFNNCSKLESISVDENNANYASQDGILYNKTKTKFIHIPRNIKGSVVIPEGITSIEDEAFYWRTNLTQIKLPNTVKRIGNSAFYRCTSLSVIEIGTGVMVIGDSAFYDCKWFTSITIPASVNSIGDSAFYNCSLLTTITFLGNKTTWNMIKKSANWNTGTGNYTIYCMDATISKS